MTVADPVEGALDVKLAPDCHQSVLKRLTRQLETAGARPCAASDLRLVVEEVMTNVVKYSGAREDGKPATVSWRIWPDRLDLVFEDPGVAFDPLGEQEQDLGDEERCEGGMGILLVRSLAERVNYSRVDGMNRLELTLSRP